MSPEQERRAGVVEFFRELKTSREFGRLLACAPAREDEPAGQLKMVLRGRDLGARNPPGTPKHTYVIGLAAKKRGKPGAKTRIIRVDGPLRKPRDARRLTPLELARQLPELSIDRLDDELNKAVEKRRSRV